MSPDPVALLRLREEELRELTRERDRLVAIGRLAAGVAHDFNNVVTVIRLCTQLLDSQSGLDEAGRKQVGHIRRETERAAALVWQFLDFAHRSPVIKVPIDLDRFLEDLVPALHLTQPAGIPILFRSDGAEHRVMADAGRLEQVVSNLITNSNDAMSETGQIAIDVDRVPARRTPGAGSGSGPWVRLSVSDGGRGIPAEVLDRIFEPFFSSKPPGFGTGLGLAQVRALVGEHDGHVEATSTEGVGTTVMIWLPALATSSS